MRAYVGSSIGKHGFGVLGDSTTGLDTTGGISTTPGVLPGVPVDIPTDCDPTTQNCSLIQAIIPPGAISIYNNPSMPCLPSGAVGPLQSGQVYCETGTTTPAAGTGTPPGTPGTPQNDIPMLAWFGLAAAISVLLLGGMLGGNK